MEVRHLGAQSKTIYASETICVLLEVVSRGLELSAVI
jgi:hypothetical protein